MSYEDFQYGDDSYREDGETQQMEAELSRMDSDNAQFIHEHKPYTVTCKCGTTETASQASLEVDGWILTDLGEVCNRCTKRIVREHLQHSRDVISLVNRLQHPPAFVPFEGYGVSE